MGLAAFAKVGLFGGGLAAGGSYSCDLRGVSGNCEDQSKANAEDLRRRADFQNSLTNYVAEFITNTDEKYFLVENELAAHNAIQSKMAATEDKIWIIIQEQLANFEEISHTLGDCDQRLSLTSNLTSILVPFLLYFQ